MKQITKGDTVYDIKGHAAEVLSPHPELSGYLVYPLYEGEDPETGPWMDRGPMDHWAQVYLSPPTEKKEAKIAELEQKISELTSEVTTLSFTRNQIQRTEKEDKARLEKLAMRSRAISRIEDFLDGKITHLLKVGVYNYRDGYAGPFKITEMKGERSGDSKDRYEPLKLLTLFGKEPGNLEFRLHTYHVEQNSGRDKTLVWPFCSLEEAQERAREMTTSQLEDWRSDSGKISPRTVRDNCIAHLGSCPEDVLQAIKENERAYKRSLVDRAKESLAKAEKELADSQAV